MPDAGAASIWDPTSGKILAKGTRESLAALSAWVAALPGRNQIFPTSELLAGSESAGEHLSVMDAVAADDLKKTFAALPGATVSDLPSVTTKSGWPVIIKVPPPLSDGMVLGFWVRPVLESGVGLSVLAECQWHAARPGEDLCLPDDPGLEALPDTGNRILGNGDVLVFHLPPAAGPRGTVLFRLQRIDPRGKPVAGPGLPGALRDKTRPGLDESSLNPVASFEEARQSAARRLREHSMATIEWKIQWVENRVPESGLPRIAEGASWEYGGTETAGALRQEPEIDGETRVPRDDWIIPPARNREGVLARGSISAIPVSILLTSRLLEGRGEMETSILVFDRKLSQTVFRHNHVLTRDGQAIRITRIGEGNRDDPTGTLVLQPVLGMARTAPDR